MLDVSAENLAAEVTAAIKFRRKHTDMTQEIVKQYAGEYYADDFVPEMRAHDGSQIEQVQMVVPAMSFGMPKLLIKSRRPVVHRVLSQTLTHAMRRWTNDEGADEFLTLMAYDVHFSFGVALVTVEPTPGFDGHSQPRLRPKLCRVSPHRFFVDPAATSWETARYMGHEWLRDLEDIKAAREIDPDNPGRTRPVFDLAALREITEGAGSPYNTIGDERGMRRHDHPDRKQIVGREIVVPEHGMIYTIASAGNDTQPLFIRPPRPMRTTRVPYTMFGVYIVPDQLYPLPLLSITQGLSEELSAHLDQVAEQADAMRTFVMVNSTDTRGVSVVKNAQNGEVIGLPGFDASSVQVVTIGGVSEAQLSYIDRLRERLDRKSGATEFMRGNLSSDTTATEAQLAATFSDARRKFMSKQFRRHARTMFLTVLETLVEINEVGFPVAVPERDPNGELANAGLFDWSSLIDIAGMGGDSESMADGFFEGGRQPGEDFSFYDLELEIEAMSMEFVEEGVRRQNQDRFFTWLLSVSVQMMQNPTLRWGDIVDAYGEALNIPDARRYINWPFVAAVLQQQDLAMYQQPRAAPGTEGRPAAAVMPQAGGSGVQTPSLALPPPSTAGVGLEGQQSGALLREAFAA